MGARKSRRPAPRWQEHAAGASTPDERLAVAYDRLRADLAYLRRPRRDAPGRAQDTARADDLAASAADYLTSLSEHAERSHAQ